MRTFTRRIFIVLFAVSSLGAVTFAVQGQGDNLLTNPGFEAPFAELENEDQIAEGWTAWSLGDEAERPLYSAASLDDADRVREGTDAQKYSSYLSAHTAGVYQTVSGLTAGETLSFSVYVYVWSSSNDTDRSVSSDPGGVTVEIGIDPTGGTDPENTAILWSAPVTIYDEYTQLSAAAEAAGDTVTVFVRSIVAEAVLVTDVFLDEAALTTGVVGITPEITPEVTEVLPTIEVLPSETPVETAIVIPSETPTLAPTIGVPTGEASATEDLALTATIEAINATSTALFAIQTSSAATLSAVPPTLELTATPDIAASETGVALQALATQGQVDFLTREAEGILTATALAASPIPASPTASLTPTFTEIAPLPTEFIPSPTAIVVTATEIPVTATVEAPTAEPTSAPTQVNQTAPEVPQGTPISPDISESFPGRLLHTVQNRETVAELAARYGSSTQAIIEANGLDENALIYIGQLLIIPVRVPPLNVTQTSPDQPDAGVTPTSQVVITLTGNEGTYVVLSGDTLSAVASKFNTTVTTIAQLNGIVNVHRLEIGQVLIVPGTAGPDVSQAIRETVVVRYGDTLNRLALRYNVSVQRIAEVNRITNINLIYAGQTLLIPVQ